jgi:hypothetical protein
MELCELDWLIRQDILKNKISALCINMSGNSSNNSNHKQILAKLDSIEASLKDDRLAAAGRASAIIGDITKHVTSVSHSIVENVKAAMMPAAVGGRRSTRRSRRYNRSRKH